MLRVALLSDGNWNRGCSTRPEPAGCQVVCRGECSWRLHTPTAACAAMLLEGCVGSTLAPNCIGRHMAAYWQLPVSL